MDAEKRKLLTQSVGFMQRYLTLTPDLVNALEKNGIVDLEEAAQIQGDDSNSGKVLELLCILKKKDDKTFASFLETLDSEGCIIVADMLKMNPTPSEAILPDGSVGHFLETFLKDYSVPQHRIDQLVEHVALKDTGSDEIPSQIKTTLQHQQHRLHQAEKNIEKAENMIKEKNMEYEILEELLDQCQNDLDYYSTACGKYKDIIKNRAWPGHSFGEPNHDLEEKLAKANMTIAKLRKDKQAILQQLEFEQEEVFQLTTLERKCKKALGLPEKADRPAIVKRIQELLKEGVMNESHIKRLESELLKVETEKKGIKEHMQHLIQEMKRLEFKLRQQEFTVRRAQHQITTRQMNVDIQSTRFSTPLKLPVIDRRGSSIGMIGPKEGMNWSYCVLCRQRYASQVPLSRECRIHYSTAINDRWTCCGKEGRCGTGCLKLPHFHIKVSKEDKVFLTDGGNFEVELTQNQPRDIK